MRRRDDMPMGVPFGQEPQNEPDPAPPLTADDVQTIKRLADIAQGPVSNTPTGERQTGMSYHEIAAHARRMLGTTEATRERVDPKVDKFSPTDHDANWQSDAAQNLYNDVGPGRTVVWKRRPGIYAGDRDEIEDLMYRIPDAKIVTRKSDDENVQSWDTVAVSVPEVHEFRRIVEEAERYENWAQSIDQETIHGSVTEHHPEYEDKRKEASENAKRRSRDMGIGVRGVSETALIPYEQALRFIPKEERQAMEARERAGGRHQNLADERAAERLDDARSKGERRGGTAFGGLQGNPKYNRFESSKDRANRERSGR